MASDSTVSMKLLIDKKSKRVLFAEANKPSVDFLFHILSLPVSNVVRLFKKEEMLPPWTNLFKSFENLNDSCIQPNKKKETLLKPAPDPFSNHSVSPLLVLNDHDHVRRKFYTCECAFTLSDDPRSYCSNCRKKTTLNLHYQSLPIPENVGFVNNDFTYMVMDDLVIKPMSDLSFISNLVMLKKFNVTDLDSLEEKVVKIGNEEALKLLKATLLTEKVLTYVFLEEEGDKMETGRVVFLEFCSKIHQTVHQVMTVFIQGWLTISGFDKSNVLVPESVLKKQKRAEVWDLTKSKDVEEVKKKKVDKLFNQKVREILGIQRRFFSTKVQEIQRRFKSF